MFFDNLFMTYLCYRSVALHHVPAACDGYGDLKRWQLFSFSNTITKLCEEPENSTASAPLEYYEIICTAKKGSIGKICTQFLYFNRLGMGRAKPACMVYFIIRHGHWRCAE